MSAAACEDRGADLFLLARDGTEPGPELRPHLASCEGCRADLERLRRFARDLPAASAGLAPRAATRAAVLSLADAPPAPPAMLGPRGPFGLVLPLAALAASAAITIVVWTRPAGRVASPAPGIEAREIFGGSALEGLGVGGLKAGSVLSAEATASVHLGAPVDAEVVLGAGARIETPGTGRTLVLLSGTAYLEPAPGDPLLLRAGGVEVEGRDARFAVERRPGGIATVTVASGRVEVRAGGSKVDATGPCRVEATEGAAPPPPVPAEPVDATAWFAYPVVQMERTAEEIVLTLKPSVPRTLRIAPWHRFDPLFSVRAQREGQPLVTVPLGAKTLLRPAPEPDADGAFLLRPDRPYRIAVDPAALGLAKGRWSLEALYTATRPGGLWRGTRASNAVEVEIR